MVPKEKDAQIYPMEKGSRELAGELRAYLSTRARDASYACNERAGRSMNFVFSGCPPPEPIPLELLLKQSNLHRTLPTTQISHASSGIRAMLAWTLYQGS
jgi:hypothetical protein